MNNFLKFNNITYTDENNFTRKGRNGWDSLSEKTFTITNHCVIIENGQENLAIATITGKEVDDHIIGGPDKFEIEISRRIEYQGVIYDAGGIQFLRGGLTFSNKSLTNTTSPSMRW